MIQPKKKKKKENFEGKKKEIYLLAPSPIFNGLFGHGGSYNNGQWQNRADGAVRCQFRERQAAADEEVDVGDPPELLEERFRQEGGKSVLGRRDIVGRVIEIAGLEAVGIVGEDDPREPGAADIRMVLLKARLRAGEAEQSAEMELLPLSSAAHLSNKIEAKRYRLYSKD